MNTPFNTPTTDNAFATKKERAAASAAFAAMVRWCKRNRVAHLDDCGEVDVTALAIACAEAHGCDDPPSDHPAWEAASAATE